MDSIKSLERALLNIEKFKNSLKNVNDFNDFF